MSTCECCRDSMTGIFLKRGKFGHRESEHHVALQAETEEMHLKPWSATEFQQPQKVRVGQSSARSCYLQNCEKMKFCCFSPSSLWAFVVAAL